MILSNQIIITGAKFGGYGSFLPTYQRSPVWSHPRTPQKIHGQNTPRSPNILQLEVHLLGASMSVIHFLELN